MSTIKNDIEINHVQNIAINNKLSRQKICISLCYSVAIWIIMIPFAICDLYFSQKNNACTNNYAKHIDINMETYLLVSGIIEVIITVLFTTTAIVTVYFNEEDTKTCIILNMIPSVPLGLFLFAWNIVGAVVFWGHIYSLTNCSYQTSTYIFTSLIIKFVSSSSLLNNSNKK